MYGHRRITILSGHQSGLIADGGSLPFERCGFLGKLRKLPKRGFNACNNLPRLWLPLKSSQLDPDDNLTKRPARHRKLEIFFKRYSGSFALPELQLLVKGGEDIEERFSVPRHHPKF